MSLPLHFPPQLINPLVGRAGLIERSDHCLKLSIFDILIRVDTVRISQDKLPFFRESHEKSGKVRKCQDMTLNGQEKVRI